MNVQNVHSNVSRAKGIRVAEWLLEFSIDRVVISEPLEGKGPHYVFSSAGVEIVHHEAETIADFLTDSGYNYKRE